MDNIDILDVLEVVELVESGENTENRRRLRIIRERPDFFSNYDEVDFFRRYLVKKGTALFVLEKIEHFLEYPDDRNDAVSPMKQFLIALRFYATGDHLLTISDLGGVSMSTTSRIVKKVSLAIASLKRDYIKFAETEEDQNQLKQDFYKIARFPQVLGTIDCTHVKIISPGGEDAEEFRNRKGYFSLNIQTISNTKLEIMNVVTRWPGSTHDGAIFTNSQINLNFARNLYGSGYLLGDSGYPLKDYLLTPYLNPSTEGQRKYNEAHIRTRNTVERQYGVLKKRFPALAVGLRLKLSTAERVIMACCILHNICIKFNEEEPPNEGLIDDIDSVIANGQITSTRNHMTDHYGSQRENLVLQYFGNL